MGGKLDVALACDTRLADAGFRARLDTSGEAGGWPAGEWDWEREWEQSGGVRWRQMRRECGGRTRLTCANCFQRANSKAGALFASRGSGVQIPSAPQM